MSTRCSVEESPAKVLPEHSFYSELEFPVFPISPGKKEPYRDFPWKEKASTNLLVIASWYSKYRGANWAAAIPLDCVVLDFDASKGGLATFESLEQTFGPFDTLTVTTGGQHGGVHAYFRASGHQLKNGPSGLPGLDIKAPGGYVLVPPSRVEREYTFRNRAPVAPMPLEFLAFLQRGFNGKARGTVVPKIERPVLEGQRNVTLASLVGTMRRRGMSHPAAMAAALEENKTFKPPLSDREVVRTVDSIYRYDPAPAEVLENRTDLGNAQLFVNQHLDIIRYCPTLGHYVYDDKRGLYLRGDEDLWLQLWRGTTQRVHARAAAIDDDDDRRRLAKYALELERLDKALKAIRFARSDPKIRVAESAFDANPWLLNVENGTIDLRLETFGFREHRASDLNTKIANVSYDPAAPCPEFLQFLSEIQPDPDVREFLREFLGYCLTGNVFEQVFALFWGDGANGKTTLAEIVQNIMGSYGSKMPFDSLLAKRLPGPSNDLARLAKVRVAFASEGPEGGRLDTPVLKQLTGSDRISARFLYKEYIEFDPSAKLILISNYRPRIDDPGDAFWRRLRLVEFPVKIPEEKRDRRLLEKLLAERSGILNWLLEGCMKWQRDGLKTPESVLQTTAEYREDSDVISEFLEERCEMGAGLEITAKQLYNAYRFWARQSGRNWLLRKIEFNARLRMKFRTKKPQNVLTWVGVGLRDPEEEDM